MPDIKHTLEIAASADRIWPALTTAGGLAGWWTLGETVLEGDPGRFAAFTFRSRAVTTEMEATILDPPKRVRWRVLRSNAPGGWEGTTITFDLSPEDGATRLDFAHDGFAEDNDGFRKVTAGWRHYLHNLQRLIEAGAAHEGEA